MHETSMNGNRAIQQHKVRTLVVGLGVTGLSVARYLLARGMQVAIADSREQPPGLAELRAEYGDVAVFLGPFDERVFAQAELLVVSPGVPISTPQIAHAAARGVQVVGDIELFASAAKAPIVAITGSNGKSTVTTLVGEMARLAGRQVAVGGNLGTPALELLDDQVELYVVELSSFQLETTSSLQAAVATVLNVQPDHMDRYPSVQAYCDAKARVLLGAGLGVYNADDPLVMAMRGDHDAWFFTLGESKDTKTFGINRIGGRDWLCRGEQVLLAADQVRIAGRHNLGNALAALAIGSALGFDLDAMTEALFTFPGLPHRTQFIAEIDGVAWYNDSKGTNVGAAVAAMRGLHQDNGGKAVIVLGGDCKGGDFSELTGTLAECARAVVLFGRDAGLIRPFVPDVCELREAGDMDRVVEQCADLAQPGDHVLLSPACASFDRFKNYMERGAEFTAAVRRLKG